MRRPKNKFLAYDGKILKANVNWNDKEALRDAARATVDEDYKRAEDFKEAIANTGVKELRKYFREIGFTFERAPRV